MNKRDFIKLKEFSKLEDVEGSVGEFFLLGKNVINQKISKRNGDPITYYEIIKKDKNGIVVLIPRYDILEEK